jgi:hypothetical protein
MDFCGRVLALSFCYFANFKLKDWHLMCFVYFLYASEAVLLID